MASRRRRDPTRVYVAIRTPSTTATRRAGHKVPNRISTYYFQDLFDHQTSEATSLILIPLLFVKELHGLKRARDVGCITFPRFLIAGYEFARQSPCGVILKFFRLLLDPGMISADALVPLKPFEDLVSLMHGQ